MVSFFVSGSPRAKQSFRYSKRGSYQRATTVEWEATVTAEAYRAMNGAEKLSGSVSVSMLFLIAGKRRVVDLDNLSKAVLDGLKGVVFDDDHWVDMLQLSKVFNADVPGVAIVVSPLSGKMLEEVATRQAEPLRVYKTLLGTEAH